MYVVFLEAINVANVASAFAHLITRGVPMVITEHAIHTYLPEKARAQGLVKEAEARHVFVAKRVIRMIGPARVELQAALARAPALSFTARPMVRRARLRDLVADAIGDESMPSFLCRSPSNLAAVVIS